MFDFILFTVINKDSLISTTNTEGQGRALYVVRCHMMHG